MANVFAPLQKEWESFGATADDVFGSGERVVSLGHYVGVANATGRPLKAAFAHVYRIVDGKVVEFRQYADSVSFLAPLEGG